MKAMDSLIYKQVVKEIRLAKDPASIGAILLDAGKITPKDAERIIALQKQQGLLFGDAAKVLGILNDDDIQKVLSSQFDYPILTSLDDNFSRELVAAYQPYSAEVESLRAVRGQLMLRWFNEDQKTVALVSPGQGEGRSHLAANLAIVFSQLGERTLLIDADLRQPTQHKLFKLQGLYGLSDFLAGRADLSVVTQIPSFRDLSILPAGTIPPNPVELISRGLKNCLHQLQTHFDVILIDTPPAQQGMDAQIVASYCGGALLLARQHHTRLDDLDHLKQDLHETGSQCLGAVVTDF